MMAFSAKFSAASCRTGVHRSALDASRNSVSNTSKAASCHGGLHPPCVQRSAGLRASKFNRMTPIRASDGNGASHDSPLDDYLEVKVDSVRVANDGSAVVHLRILEGDGAVLPVHIGQSESNALMSEISQKRQHKRPLTHDITKNMLLAIGYRISKIRITEIVSNTYYARIHLAVNNGTSTQELDIDARPSDAINLAVRFGAKMFVNKSVAAVAASPCPDRNSQQSETHADILKSIRETISNFEDPTVMYQLEKDIAVTQERFEDARAFHNKINYEMTKNPELRLIVAMEAAAADGRFEEAARLRDEFNRTFRGNLSERK